MPERTAATLTSNEARVNGIVVPASLRVDVESLKPSNSTIYGVRAGHWFDWFGIAVDVATLDPDVKRQTIRATGNLRFDEEVFGEQVTIDPGQAVSVDIPRVTVPTTATAAALAMVRVPGGSVEPYAFAGPVYLVTDSDLGGDWGLRAGGGIRLPLSRRVALFGEYRYTAVDAEAFVGRIRGSMQGVEGSTGRIRAAVDIRNHSAIGGVSFSF
jgi:opacity protein-like surface antigen